MQEGEEAAAEGNRAASVARTGGRPIGDYWFLAAELDDFGDGDKKLVVTKTGAPRLLFCFQHVLLIIICFLGCDKQLIVTKIGALLLFRVPYLFGMHRCAYSAGKSRSRCREDASVVKAHSGSRRAACAGVQLMLFLWQGRGFCTPSESERCL